MMTLRQLAAEPPVIPTRASWYLADLGESKGRYELFTRQSPQKLKVLREHALGEKTVLVEDAIARQTGLFSLSDLQQACPGVGVDLIRAVLKRLYGKTIECLGRGHTAKWRKRAK